MAKIQEKEIQKMMSALEISREEAIEMLSFDKEEIDNEEVAKIEEKTKTEEKPKKPKTDSLAKVKMQKAKKKADEVKENLMAILKRGIGVNESFINPQDMTSSKITFKATDGSYYTVSLTKHKAKPDGYTD